MRTLVTGPDCQVFKNAYQKMPLILYNTGQIYSSSHFCQNNVSTYLYYLDIKTEGYDYMIH